MRTIVPRRWPGATFVCIAGGPSLTPQDVDACRGRARLIAVNDAYRLAPWADVLYACDAQWWRWHAEAVRDFAGLKYGLKPLARKWVPDVQILRNTGREGLETDPGGLRTGQNSGYQAINLAYHLGAAKIILLGYDLQIGPGQRSHWFGDHPNKQRPPLRHMRQFFPSLAKGLRDVGVEVINCSPQTALDCFERRPLADTLLDAEAIAC